MPCSFVPLNNLIVASVSLILIKLAAIEYILCLVHKPETPVQYCFDYLDFISEENYRTLYQKKTNSEAML